MGGTVLCVYVGGGSVEGGSTVSTVGRTADGAGTVGKLVGTSSGGSVVTLVGGGSVVGADGSNVRVGATNGGSSIASSSSPAGEVGSYNCGNSVGEEGGCAGAMPVGKPTPSGWVPATACISSSSSAAEVGDGICVGTGISVGERSDRCVGTPIRLRLGTGISEGSSVGAVMRLRVMLGTGISEGSSVGGCSRRFCGRLGTAIVGNSVSTSTGVLASGGGTPAGTTISSISGILSATPCDVAGGMGGWCVIS